MTHNSWNRLDPGIPEPCSQVRTLKVKKNLTSLLHLRQMCVWERGVTLSSDVDISVFLLRLWRAMRNWGMDFCSFHLECVISPHVLNSYVQLHTLVSFKPTFLRVSKKEIYHTRWFFSRGHCLFYFFTV